MVDVWLVQGSEIESWLKFGGEVSEKFSKQFVARRLNVKWFRGRDGRKESAEFSRKVENNMTKCGKKFYERGESHGEAAKKLLEK